ncbi:glycoside hydrolase family protein [Actinobaculum suis]|uniref:Glycoside hydrolase family protein n=1 Tax=Actinobaculum suis TaxID=1657 RepID=A0A7Z9C8V2_9ACTO|nr:glycoside hydrolase family 13 protein [Actinobaculum suis]VDG75442.1 glycoside hydrolase family protein [Actinobaculum suis]
MQELHSARPRTQWWQDAVVYQVYPRSFASSRGAMGDLPGITSKLAYIASLGVDAIWLSPFYKSPQRDAGYDVSDYRQVDPLFGTLEDAQNLIDTAHSHGLKVIVDIVPNHTSWEHELFRKAIAAGPGSPEREMFWFREGRGADGTEPPTDWISVFGGPAWSQVKDIPWVKGTPAENDEQFYLHLFDPGQPDVNWEHPAIHAEFRDTLRFWLDRGVDGFRVDVAHGLVKDPALPDWETRVRMVEGEESSFDAGGDAGNPPMFDQDGVHDIYREWRSVLDEYGRDRMLVAEAWVGDEERLSRYIRHDEMQQAFNFIYLAARWDPAELRRVVEESFRTADSVGAPTTWVLSNHDTVRATTRLGLAETGKGPNGIAATDPQPDVELGARRARAWHLLTAMLPGSYYIYQGEERELPEHTALPAEVREDPAFFRTGGEEAGRDGCRVPLPWNSDQPGFGFSASGETWLPQPAEWERYTVDAQEVAGLTAVPSAATGLPFFRRLLALRKEWELGSGSLADCSEQYAPAGIAFCNRAGQAAAARPDLLAITAFDTPIPFPGEEWTLVLSSQPLAEAASAQIPADTTAWFIRARD